MRLLVLSYNALSGAGRALIDGACERGAEVERLELRPLMALNRRELSLYSRFIRRAKELMSTFYKAYDPLDESFIDALTAYIDSGSFDAVVGVDAYAIRVITCARQRGLKPLCYAVITDYEAVSIPSIGMLDGYFIAYDDCHMISV